MNKLGDLGAYLSVIILFVVIIIFPAGDLGLGTIVLLGTPVIFWIIYLSLAICAFLTFVTILLDRELFYF